MIVGNNKETVHDRSGLVIILSDEVANGIQHRCILYLQGVLLTGSTGMHDLSRAAYSLGVSNTLNHAIRNIYIHLFIHTYLHI
jgi:multisubunit Na+/H+ antiporter MnhG subunit